MHGAAPRGGAAYRVGRCAKDHRIIRAIAVDVSRGVAERACPVRRKSALDRRAITSVIKTGRAKRVVARASGGAKRGSIRFFHGPRTDPACSAATIALHTLALALGHHPKPH